MSLAKECYETLLKNIRKNPPGFQYNKPVLVTGQWIHCVDTNGRMYYHDLLTGKSQWEKPEYSCWDSIREDEESLSEITFSPPTTDPPGTYDEFNSRKHWYVNSPITQGDMLCDFREEKKQRRTATWKPKFDPEKIEIGDACQAPAFGIFFEAIIIGTFKTGPVVRVSFNLLGFSAIVPIECIKPSAGPKYMKDQRHLLRMLRITRELFRLHIKDHKWVTLNNEMVWSKDQHCSVLIGNGNILAFEGTIIKTDLYQNTAVVCSHAFNFWVMYDSSFSKPTTTHLWQLIDDRRLDGCENRNDIDGQLIGQMYKPIHKLGYCPFVFTVQLDHLYPSVNDFRRQQLLVTLETANEKFSFDVNEKELQRTPKLELELISEAEVRKIELLNIQTALFISQTQTPKRFDGFGFSTKDLLESLDKVNKLQNQPWLPDTFSNMINLCDLIEKKTHMILFENPDSDEMWQQKKYTSDELEICRLALMKSALGLAVMVTYARPGLNEPVKNDSPSQALPPVTDKSDKNPQSGDTVPAKEPTIQDGLKKVDSHATTDMIDVPSAPKCATNVSSSLQKDKSLVTANKRFGKPSSNRMTSSSSQQKADSRMTADKPSKTSPLKGAKQLERMWEKVTESMNYKLNEDDISDPDVCDSDFSEDDLDNPIHRSLEIQKERERVLAKLREEYKYLPIDTLESAAKLVVAADPKNGKPDCKAHALEETLKKLLFMMDEGVSYEEPAEWPPKIKQPVRLERKTATSAVPSTTKKRTEIEKPPTRRTKIPAEDERIAQNVVKEDKRPPAPATETVPQGGTEPSTAHEFNPASFLWSWVFGW